MTLVNNRLIKCSRDLYSHLRLHATTGVLSLNRALDYEQCTKYSYLIRASDAIEHRLSSLLNLQIHVSDVNDNPTKFVSGRFMFRVLENVIENGTNLRINLTDADTTRASLEFRFETENNEEREINELNELFEVREAPSLDNNDLAVYLATKRMFDYELKRRYFFRIVLTDERGVTDSTQIEVKHTF